MRPIDADALKKRLDYCTTKGMGSTIAFTFKHIIDEQPTIQPERTEERMETHACDLISRQQAIDGKISIQRANGVEIYSDEAVPVEYLKNLPTIQPEPAIPLSWIEKYIEWLKSFDNEFANLEAAHISVMVKKWRDERDE